MNSPIKIFGVRSNLLGDQITCLGILNALKKKYPNSEITWAVAKKSTSSIPFLKNHPLITNFIISQENEGQEYLVNGKLYNQEHDPIEGYDIQINVNPRVTNPTWFNSYNLIEENFRMCFGSSDEYNDLTEDERLPRLYVDFDVKRPETEKKVIYIAGFAGYGQCRRRSPSIDWWQELVSKIKEKYYLVQIGHPNDPHLGTEDIRNLELLEQIKHVLGGDLFLCVEGGLAWINGAYGITPQINLLTNAVAGHITNNFAWEPKSRGKFISHFAPDNINNINQDEVINSIESLIKV